MIELCIMCKFYLVECSREEVRCKKNETYDGFKVKIEICDKYERVLLEQYDAKNTE